MRGVRDKIDSSFKDYGLAKPFSRSNSFDDFSLADAHSYSLKDFKQ